MYICRCLHRVYTSWDWLREEPFTLALRRAWVNGPLRVDLRCLCTDILLPVLRFSADTLLVTCLLARGIRLLLCKIPAGTSAALHAQAWLVWVPWLPWILYITLYLPTAAAEVGWRHLVRAHAQWQQQPDWESAKLGNRAA